MKWVAVALAVVLLLVGVGYMVQAENVATKTQADFALNNPNATGAPQQAVVNGWETNGWLDGIFSALQGVGYMLAGILVLLSALLLSKSKTRLAPTPAAAQAPLPAGWQADPTKRHESRYWDGARWTENVSDAGAQSSDPL